MMTINKQLGIFNKFCNLNVLSHQFLSLTFFNFVFSKIGAEQKVQLMAITQWLLRNYEITKLTFAIAIIDDRREREREGDKETERQKDRDTRRQKDKKTETQEDRKTR